MLESLSENFHFEEIHNVSLNESPTSRRAKLCEDEMLNLLQLFLKEKKKSDPNLNKLVDLILNNFMFKNLYALGTICVCITCQALIYKFD